MYPTFALLYLTRCGFVTEVLRGFHNVVHFRMFSRPDSAVSRVSRTESEELPEWSGRCGLATIYNGLVVLEL